MTDETTTETNATPDAPASDAVAPPPSAPLESVDAPPSTEPAGELFRVVSRERVEKGVRITAATCDEELGYEISLVLPDNEETRKTFDTGCSFYVDITPA